MSGVKKKLRAPVDLAMIERDYSSSLMTLADLSAKYGVSAPTICRWAREKGWTRDQSLRSRIADAAKGALSDATIHQIAHAPETMRIAKAAVSHELDPEDNIQAAVATHISIVLAHRQDLAQLRNLSQQMMTELFSLAASREQAKALAEMAALEKTAEIDDPVERSRKVAHAVQGFLRATDLNSRSAVLQRISDVITKVIDKEREAFGLDADKDAAQKTVSVVIHTDVESDE